DRALGRLFQEAARQGLSGQHFLDAPAEVRITRAGLVEVGGTLLRRALLQGGKEDGLEWRRMVHGGLTTGQCDRRPAITSPRILLFAEDRSPRPIPRRATTGRRSRTVPRSPGKRPARRPHRASSARRRSAA